MADVLFMEESDEEMEEEITEKEFGKSEELARMLVDISEGNENEEEEEQKEQALRQAMNGLTDKCREALKKYYFENKNMDTIAQEAQLANREQAKKAVHRCRESLRSLLSGHPIFKNV